MFSNIAALLGRRAAAPTIPQWRLSRPPFRPSLERLEIRAMVSHVVGEHIHPTLQILIEGIEVPIPADIGLTPSRHYHPHTHDDSGELHVGEGPISGIDPLDASPRLTTLEDFFDVWRTTNVGTSRNNPDAFFSENQILDRVADAHHAVRMTVNGEPNFEFENYSPHDLDQIVISYAALANTPPTANAQNVDVAFGGTRPVTLSGDDGEPDREQPLSFRVASLPTHGVLRNSAGAAIGAGATLTSNSVTYAPAAGFAGADSFTFVALDGGEDGTSAPAAVTLDVAPNSAPTADAQSVNVRTNVPRTITLSGDDGDASLTQDLSFRVQTLPENGTLQTADGTPVAADDVLADADVTYVPDAGFAGADGFTFLVQDDGGTMAGGVDTSAAAAVEIEVVNSVDPNDILGPEGVGDEHWVSSAEALAFTIRFENWAAATAPAQEVVVQAALDDGLDWSTFRFGDIGFGDTRIEAAQGATSVDTTMALPPSHGTDLELTITAGVTDGVASWRLLALDPATGALPEEPLAGFLPPNRDDHRGEGFLQFTVQPRSDLAIGTRVDVSAIITFDTNPGMRTNELFYSVRS